MRSVSAGPPTSVVDYEAWKKGYTPPSEHILIDQLAYRGARVAMMSDWGEEVGAFWVVVRGRPLDRVTRKQMFGLLSCAFPEPPQEPYEYDSPWC